MTRLPAAAMGCAVVLLGAWMAARWFGREAGLLCGVVLATTYELYQYATLAEDDIYLAAVAVACAAMFVKAEWAPDRPAAVADDAGDGARRVRTWRAAFFGWRPWPTVLFFVLLGLTNLAKGPLVGALPIAGRRRVPALEPLRAWPVMQGRGTSA